MRVDKTAKSYGKASFFCQARDKELPFKVEIKMDASGHFYCLDRELPEEIKAQMPERFSKDGKGHVSSDTLRGFERNVEKIIRDFEELQVEEDKEKIIRYRIDLQGCLTPDLSGDHPDFKQHTDLDRDDHNLGLATKWLVCWKHNKGGRVRYCWENGSEFNTWKNDYKEMPWTQEREDWFHDLDRAMVKLVTLVDDYFKTPEASLLMNRIDAGLKFLEPPKDDQNPL